MDFHLSDDQRALQEAVRRFVDDQCDNGVRRRAFEGESGSDPAFWSGLLQLGAGALLVDQQYGGLGLPLIDAALVAEVLGHAGAPGPFLGHTLAVLAIQQAGSEVQKATWLPQLASGELTATIALGEAGERWSPTDWSLLIDDAGRLTGVKANVIFPEEADLIVVGLKGGAFAVVETKGADLEFESLDVVDRTRRLQNVHFAETPAEALPGRAADAVYDALLVLLAADAFGGASRILEMTAEYAKTRKQFGGPIARFQGLKHQLANLASEIAPCEGLYWYAAVAYDADPEARSRVAALAKAHLGDRFMQMARSGVELHGGIGYTWEYELQIWVKRAMFDFTYGGAPSFLRARAAGLDPVYGEAVATASLAGALT